MSRHDYWGTPPSYPKGTPGHELSDHYRPTSWGMRFWQGVAVAAFLALVAGAVMG